MDDCFDAATKASRGLSEEKHLFWRGRAMLFVTGPTTKIPTGHQRFTPIYRQLSADPENLTFVCNLEGWSHSSCALGSISNVHGLRPDDIEEFYTFISDSSVWNSGWPVKNFTMCVHKGQIGAWAFATKYGEAIKAFKNRAHEGATMTLFFFNLP